MSGVRMAVGVGLTLGGGEYLCNLWSRTYAWLTESLGWKSFTMVARAGIKLSRVNQSAVRAYHFDNTMRVYGIPG